ncbi:hypothetical protein QBC45DRAFT_324765, partial [Copromyces sp. CBS 386.78]
PLIPPVTPGSRGRCTFEPGSCKSTFVFFFAPLFVLIAVLFCAQVQQRLITLPTTVHCVVPFLFFFFFSRYQVMGGHFEDSLINNVNLNSSFTSPFRRRHGCLPPSTRKQGVMSLIFTKARQDSQSDYSSGIEAFRVYIKETQEFQRNSLINLFRIDTLERHAVFRFKKDLPWSYVAIGYHIDRCMEKSSRVLCLYKGRG